METSLHRTLKESYADSPEATEVRLGRFRIDAIRNGRLIEVQHASLASIRTKVHALLREHEVTVVKPLVRRRLLVKWDPSNTVIVDRRWSPKQGHSWQLFDELIFFTQLFPHRRLRLEFPIIDVEEWRVPVPHRGWRRNPYRIKDQQLLAHIDNLVLEDQADLLRCLGGTPKSPFHTGDLGQFLGVERWQAQRIAYCLRKCGCVTTTGKKGNAWLYRVTPPTPTGP